MGERGEACQSHVPCSGWLASLHLKSCSNWVLHEEHMALWLWASMRKSQEITAQIPRLSDTLDYTVSNPERKMSITDTNSPSGLTQYSLPHMTSQLGSDRHSSYIIYYMS